MNRKMILAMVLAGIVTSPCLFNNKEVVVAETPTMPTESVVVSVEPEWMDTVSAPMETESEEVFVSVSFIPESVQQLCYEIGEEYHIAPELLIAIIEVESGGDVNAKNKYSGCMGLMQLHPRYANYYLEKAGCKNPYDAGDNIRAGCEILLEKFETYTDLPLVLMKYHGESDAYSRYVKGNYSTYCKKIIARTDELQNERGELE